jgi:cytochrome c oxidase assembly factor CtaG
VDPYAWTWNVEALVVVPLVTAVYLLALRDHPAPAWRVACFLTAMGGLLAVAVTPVDMLAHHFLLTIHLLQNVVLAEWAPLLIVLGIPPALAAALARRRAVRLLTHPLVALPLWLGTYMVWHLPWVYDTALRHEHSLLDLEHAMFLLTGVAMWWSVFQDEPHRLAPAVRSGYVFAAFVLGSPIGLVIALVPRAIYSFYVHAPMRLWGLSPLEDQQIAGVGMAVEQSVVFFAVFAYWFFRFLAEEERRADVDRPTEAA